MITNEKQTNVIEGFKLQTSAPVCYAWQQGWISELLSLRSTNMLDHNFSGGGGSTALSNVSRTN